MRRGILVIACAAIGTATSLTVCDAAAQPTVRVRSEARIELRTIRRDTRVEIEGVLRDDLGQPLAQRNVVLHAQARSTDAGPPVRHATETDHRGRFRVPLPASEEDYRVTARFAGDRTHDRVEVERHLDLSRDDVRLRVSVPHGGRLDLDEREHRIVVHAESAHGAGGLRVELVDELGRRLGQGQTDRSGQVRFIVPSERLGPPGAGRLKARSAGDADRAEAQTEVPIVRYRHTELQLTASPTRAAPGETVALEGQLRDSQGPLAERAVGLFALGGNGRDDMHLATLLTGQKGRFTHTLGLERAHGERLRIEARFQSDTPGRGPTASEPITVRVATPSDTRWAWLLLPFALCGLLLAVLYRRERGAAVRIAATSTPRHVGIEAADRQLRRPTRFDIAGHVVDHRDDGTVREAMVTLVGEDGTPLPVRMSDTGAFWLERVPAGRWTLRVEAEGYAPADAELTVPHRGEWSALRVRLESLRARALHPFQRVATRLLPSMGHWPVKTNREVIEEATTVDPIRQRLAHLGQRVERVYYGPQAPSREEIERIEEEGARLLAELRHAPGDEPGDSR